MQTKDTHNRDSRYNSDLRTEVEVLSRRFNELETFLRNYLEEANDEKIKSNRRLQDTLYNLDEENIPSLPGIIKISKEGYEMAGLIAEVNENGEVVAKASVIVEAINNQSSVKIKADVLDIDVSDKVTIGDSIVIDPGGSFSIDDTFGDDGTKLITFWDSKGIRFNMYGPDSADQWGATYEADVIYMSGNQHETTITSEEISTDRVAVNYLNGYKISFDENGYLKGVKE